MPKVTPKEVKKEASNKAIVMLSALLCADVDYHDKMYDDNADFWEAYSNGQIAKAYTEYSKRIRQYIADGKIRAVLADKKFVIGYKKKRGTDEKVPTLLQDIVIQWTPIAEKLNRAILKEVAAEVPYNAAPRGSGIKGTAVSIEDLDSLSDFDFDRMAEQTAATLQSRIERGKKLGAQAKTSSGQGRKVKTEEEDEEEKRARRAALKRKQQEELEELDEEDEDKEETTDTDEDDFTDLDTDTDEDEEEQEPAPKPKKREKETPAPVKTKRRAPAVEDEDDEDEDEPAPRVKAKEAAPKRRRPSGF